MIAYMLSCNLSITVFMATGIDGLALCGFIRAQGYRMFGTGLRFYKLIGLLMTPIPLYYDNLHNACLTI